MKTLRMERYILMEAGEHNWKICGACVQGLDHLTDGIPCQDKIYSLRENGVTSIALADGAGSAPFSHVGAQTAVRVLCAQFCSCFREIITAGNVTDAKQMILGAVLNELRRKAEIIGCDVHDMASTLIGVACCGESALIVHIGDGAAACFRNGGTVSVSAPYSGGFANETVFTTSDSALQLMRVARIKLEGIGGFVLMSDGADFCLYDRRGKKFASILGNIYRDCVMYSEEDNNSDIEELLASVIRQKTGDDCGLIAVCRSCEYFRGYRDLSSDEQSDFLGSNNARSKKEREKIFDFLSRKEKTSRNELVRLSGFRRKKILGILRRLDRKGFISRSSRSYALNFSY